jgi:hypothetical protein
MPRVQVVGAADRGDATRSDRCDPAGRGRRDGRRMMRSSSAVVRNPVLGLAAAQRLADLDPTCQAALRAVLMDIRAEANVKAEDAWRRRKGPMAAYWRATSTYAGHIARAIRAGGTNA